MGGVHCWTESGGESAHLRAGSASRALRGDRRGGGPSESAEPCVRERGRRGWRGAKHTPEYKKGECGGLHGPLPPGTRQGTLPESSSQERAWQPPWEPGLEFLSGGGWGKGSQRGFQSSCPRPGGLWPSAWTVRAVTLPGEEVSLQRSPRLPWCRGHVQFLIRWPLRSLCPAGCRGGGGGRGCRGHKDDFPRGALSLTHASSPLPAGKAGLSATGGLSSAMGVGVSLLLQFSLTSGGYPSVGRSRRSSRRSIPGNSPRRSWAKPHLQLHSLQGRVWASLLDSRTISWPQCPTTAGVGGGAGGRRGEVSRSSHPGSLPRAQSGRWE